MNVPISKLVIKYIINAMGGSFTKKASAITLKDCTLWKADRSPACRTVMMALDALNLSINEVDINFDKDEHKSMEIAAMNPLQTLPVFRDKDLVLYDSHAISSYLVSRYSNDCRLLPSDPGGISRIEQLMHYDSGVLYPKYKSAAYPILYQDCKHIMPQHVADIENAYAELEHMLLGRTWFSNYPWPMLSDICICATVSTLNVMVPIDRVRYPRLSSWLQRMSEETFYLTANQKGLCEFSRRIDCGQFCGDDVNSATANSLGTSHRRRYVSQSQRFSMKFGKEMNT